MSMSGSDMVVTRDQFSVGMHNPQSQPQQQQPQLHQNMRMDYAAADGAAVFGAPTININNINGGESSPVSVPPGLGLGHTHPQGMVDNSTETLKRKRGRPRKYGPDGGMALSLNTTSPPGGASVPVGHSGGAFPAAPLSDSASAGTGKRRGRPRGSVNKNKKTSKFSGPGGFFTPHVITVKAGEDLSARIMSISQSGSRNVCILSANGSISNVTLRQPASSGGTVTYEGRFEILSLGGSLFLTENGSHGGRTGGLSVSLSGPDGRVLGGGVAGLLVAASPVQIVLASFVSDGKQSKSAKRMRNVSAAEKVATAGGQSSSPSRGTLSESSGGVGSGSPLNQSTGDCINNINNINSTTPTPGFSGMPWK
ncbi:AT-hook motif nuclear-localized protein 10 [Vigna umbellata]|uniref:AT-hook motif nuclear-localized protein 10 n=1 Tax=Vigna umbellata TaxID=87088 RepID=UPI001F5E419B|nr:AT-hook motif nuclear-localized protein 10 [Vigna umbellata]XP_047165745.1 AT-hook motif nuclear-localized protein 10 [Vigna umbellata]